MRLSLQQDKQMVTKHALVFEVAVLWLGVFLHKGENRSIKAFLRVLQRNTVIFLKYFFHASYHIPL